MARTHAGPAVALAATTLQATCPTASPREILDACLAGCVGPVSDFGPALSATEPFGLLVAKAFDDLMPPTAWEDWTQPGTDPALISALEQILRTYVLPKFAACYGLTYPRRTPRADTLHRWRCAL